jgi:hypothetical protein
MKKLFFSVFLFLFVISRISIAQFILNSSYNPVVGDSVVERYIDTTGIAQGEAGANKVWNFQNLTFTGNLSIEYFVLPSSTAYYSLFPNSNLASIHLFDKASTSMPHYFCISDTAFAQIGYVYPSNPVMITRFINPFIRNHYPTYFGSQFVSNYYSTTTSGNYTEYVWGTKMEICDGYGTIILPSGIFNKVIRVKTNDDEMDTVKINGVVTNVYHNVSENYFWFVQGQKFPVFLISYSTYSNTYSKVVSYCIENEPVGINQISTSVPEKYSLYQNYPNPFNPVTNIKFDISKENFITIKIYNIKGQLIETLVNQKLSTGKYSVQWDAVNNSSGLYFYQLSIDYIQYDIKKMMIIK